MSDPNRTIDDLRTSVGEYARVLQRRWRIALGALGLVGSCAFWSSQYLPRQYSATTIFERREDVVLGNLIHTNSPYSFDHLKSSLVLDMTGSRALAGAAIDIGILSPDLVQADDALSDAERRALDAAIGRYDLRASVKLVHSSPTLDTIQVTAEANDSRIAARFVTALRDRYIMQTRERITEILETTRDFFQSELQTYQTQASQADQALQNQFADFPGIDPTDPRAVGQRLEQIRAERLRLFQAKAEIEAEIGAREAFLVGSLSTAQSLTAVAIETNDPRPQTTSDPELDRLDHEITLVDQQITEATTVKRMTAAHPTVSAMRRHRDRLIAARDELTALLAKAAATQPVRLEPTPAPDPVMASHRMRVELELDALHRQQRAARDNVDTVERRFAKFNTLYERLIATNDELETLQARHDESTTTASIWRGYLSQLARILAAEKEQRGTVFTLVEEPNQRSRATKPGVAAIFAVCSGCGLAASAVLIALSELMDRSFRSVGQVTRALGLPILETVGVIFTPTERRRRLRTRIVWVPAASLLVMALVGTAALAYTSLELPNVHEQAVSAIDGALQAVGAPVTQLADSKPE